MFAGRPTISVACMFLARVGPAGCYDLTLAEQCAQPLKNRRVIGWLMVTGRLAASADYLVATRLNVGDMASRHHPEFFLRFCATASELGFGAKAVQLQWSTLVKIAIIHRALPNQVTAAQLLSGRQALVRASAEHAQGDPRRTAAVVTKDVFGIEATLVHLGVIDEPPTKAGRDKAAERAAQWAAVPAPAGQDAAGLPEAGEGHAATLDCGRDRGGLAGVRRLPGTPGPRGACVADIRRSHIEAYKTRLATNDGRVVPPLRQAEQGVHRRSRQRRARLLRTSQRMGRRRRPGGPTGLSGDTPILDQPLPRFSTTPPPPSSSWRRAPILTPSCVWRWSSWPGQGCEGRAGGPDGRRRRADRLVVLAARAAGKAAPRPLHPVAPSAQGTARRLDRTTAGDASLQVPVLRARPSPHRVRWTKP